MRRIILAYFSLTATIYPCAEAVTHPTGLSFLEPAAYQSIPLAAPLFSGSIPATVELSPFPDVGDQGVQGSCVGWAVAYALKTYQEEVKRHWGVATNDHRFSPAFIYDQIKPPGDCRVGTFYADALDLLTRQGVVPMSEFPYDPSRCDRLPDQRAIQLALGFRIASWRRVNTLDETEVKTHLASGYPVLIGMPVDQSFMDLRGPTLYQGLSGPSLGGHAMLVSGYDDTRGAFHLINSWGSSWADRGTGWITYPAFRKTIREGYVTQDLIAFPGGGSARNTIEVETIITAEVPLGRRSETRTTGDHHCAHNCEGEPTRTNYTLDLAVDPTSRLKNPVLRCLSGPCQGWNAILVVRIESGGNRAHASWDVWSHTSTWELSAEEYRIAEVSRFVRHVEPGKPFTVLAETTGPAPLVKGTMPSGEAFSFLAGRPTLNRFIRLSRTQVQGPETVYEYEITLPEP